MQAQSLDVRPASPGVDLPRLLAACVDIKAALVMGLDGEIRATHGPSADALKTSISFAVGILDLAQRLCEESGSGMLRSHVLSAEAGTLVLHHLGEDTIVVLLAEPSTPLGALLHDLRHVIDQPDAPEESAWT